MRAQLAPVVVGMRLPRSGASEHAFGGGKSAVARASRGAGKALGWGHPYDAISNITSKAQKNAIDTLSSTGTVTSSAVQNTGTYTSAYTYASAKAHAPTEVDDTVPTGVSTTPIKGAFTYDPSGNQSGWTRKGSASTTSRVLTFDEENRLTKVTQNGVEIQSSLYDAA